MPSLFSRSRTTSTPKRTSSELPFDEFGRINSRGTPKGTGASPATSKKDKKAKDKGRLKGAASPSELELPEFSVPDGSFLPLNLDPQRYEPGEEPSQERRQLHDYGYLSYQRHVVLGLEEVTRLVDVVGNELGTRGLTTPFIFSTLALDVSASAVKRLINAFLNTCHSHPTQDAERLWRDEARFAGPHELGMFLRWGLARVVRIVGGQEVRGLVSYDNYIDWSDSEATLKYPPTHFVAFLAPLEPILRTLLVGLLTLLTKFTAHSASSGHTPPTLSPLFGPLLFGLGPSTLAFHHVYMHYLRAVTATEHLILSFIRWQDAPGAAEGTSATALGVPTRLKAWIQGYPSMLPTINHLERPQPRRGARTTRIISVRRNVRMYSSDLVKTAAGWAQRPRGPTSPTSDRSFAYSKEWDRISPPTLKLPPRYSDAYRKRMDLAPNFHPDTGAGSSASVLSAPALSVSNSSASSFFEDRELGGTGAPEDRFRSLTDLKWGEFETMGFGDVGADEKKLQFDLTESARAARSAKRTTLSWQDFSAAGFSRTDAPLSATLQFSSPVTNSVNTWPTQSAELHRKLKKTAKGLPAFGWDTEPIMGSEEVIEEAFIDVFCDLVYGGGWMDVERSEEIDRECNWALVEFKSLPVAKGSTVSGTNDPRTTTTVILFEEFVPLEYRRQLQANGTSRRRLPSLFGTSSKKQWKPAATLNGRPYVVGHVPHSPSYREAEFEGLLRSNDSVTKVISLKTPDRQSTRTTGITMSPISSPVQTQSRPNLFLTPTISRENHIHRTSSRSSDNHDSPSVRSSTPVPSTPTVKKHSKFRLPLTPVTSRTSGLPPAEYDTVEFEARVASFDDDDPTVPANSKHRRRQSKDDAWVDILVANSARRLNAQDADLRNALKGGRSDPELASQEVSEVLAAVRGQMLSDDEDDSIVPASGFDDGYSQSNITVSEDDRDTISARNIQPAYADEEPAEPISTPIMKKRLGYFDLHPERRNVKHDGEEDSQQSFESSPQTLNDVLSNPPRPSTDTEESHYDDAYDAIVPTATQPPLLPPKLDHNGTLRSSSPFRSPTNGHSVPAVAVLPPPEEPTPPVHTPSPQPSKTATLIEMYRERERASQSPSSPIPASKLPVRSVASLQPNTLGVQAAAPARPISPANSPSPSIASIELDDSLSQQPYESRNVGYDADSGVVTPSRYVHGAPLHNVLEEEEEEEE